MIGLMAMRDLAMRAAASYVRSAAGPLGPIGAGAGTVTLRGIHS